MTFYSTGCLASYLQAFLVENPWLPFLISVFWTKVRSHLQCEGTWTVYDRQKRSGKYAGDISTKANLEVVKCSGSQMWVYV